VGLLASAVVGVPTDCTRTNDSSVGDVCSYAYTSCGFKNPSLCTNSKYPFCVLSNSGSGSEVAPANLPVLTANLLKYSCVQCISDCDCGPGYACQIFFNSSAANVATWGTCVSGSPALGSSCDYTLSSTSQADLKYGTLPPHRGCFTAVSEVLYNNPTTTFYEALFVGQCIAGTCRECDSTFVLEKAGALTEVSVAGQNVASLYCVGYKSPPQVCRSFSYHSFSAGSLSRPSLLANLVILSVVAAIMTVA